VSEWSAGGRRECVCVNPPPAVVCTLWCARFATPVNTTYDFPCAPSCRSTDGHARSAHHRNHTATTTNHLRNRRVIDFGKFFAEYAEMYAKPLNASASENLLAYVGLHAATDLDQRDAKGHVSMWSSFRNLPMLDPKVEQLLARKKSAGTFESEFVRAYTWLCFTLMQIPASSEPGCVIAMDYAFVGMAEAGKLQNVFGKKLQKSLGKLFHGTCPLKIKSIILINCPWWIRMLMAFARIFVSSKIMSRMHVMGGKHEKLASYYGGPEFIPRQYFAEAEAAGASAAAAADGDEANGGGGGAGQ
jgi:hypothetical protein